MSLLLAEYTRVGWDGIPGGKAIKNGKKRKDSATYVSKVQGPSKHSGILNLLAILLL